MKKVVIAFGTVFALFFVVGLVQELVTTRDREFFTRVARQNLHVVRRDARVFLTYSCRGTPLYAYDLDRQTLTASAAAFLPLANAASKELPSATVKTGLFTIMLGGGAWSAKDAVGMLRDEDKSAATIIAAVVGALSGYTVGRYVALHSSARAACDGPDVMALVSDRASWPSLSRDAYMILLMESIQRAIKLSRHISNYYSINTTVTQQLFKLRESAVKRYPSFTVTSADFTSLAELDRQMETPLSRLTPWERFGHYALVVVSVIGAVITLLSIVFVVAFRD